MVWWLEILTLLFAIRVQSHLKATYFPFAQNLYIKFFFYQRKKVVIIVSVYCFIIRLLSSHFYGILVAVNHCNVIHTSYVVKTV